MNNSPKPVAAMNTKNARIFEFKDDKSSKFWEINLNGSTVIVRYGKTGTNGHSQEKGRIQK